jgi:hypothetical protein
LQQKNSCIFPPLNKKILTNPPYDDTRLTKVEETKMAAPKKKSRNVYELLENDLGEIMALIFSNGVKPQNPTFRLNEANRNIELYHTDKDVIILEGIQPETIEKFKDITKLYVCEMQYDETSDERKILFAYEALLKKEAPKEEGLKKNAAPQKPDRPTDLKERARLAREKIIAQNRNNPNA